MTEIERDRMRDEACIWMMEQTSWRYPRDRLLDCRHCHQPFWARNRRRYCRATCRAARWYTRWVVKPRERRARQHNRERTEIAA